MVIETCGYKFEVTAKFKETINGFKYEKNSKGFHNLYRVSVKNLETGVKVAYDFTDSIANNNIFELKDLRTALYCLFADASSCDSFEDFCSDFGYDSDSITAHKIFKACQAQYKGVLKLGVHKDDIYDIQNDLS